MVAVFTGEVAEADRFIIAFVGRILSAAVSEILGTEAAKSITLMALKAIPDNLLTRTCREAWV